MIDKLNQLQPIVIFISLAIFFTLESIIPNLTEYQSRKKHTLRNLGLSLLGFIANGLAGTWLAFWLLMVQQHQWGLLNLLHFGVAPNIVAGIFLVDLDMYIEHRISHKVPLLWRLHQVHHSDNLIDSTSSLRVHPLEVLFQVTWRTITFGLLGIPFASVVVLFIIFLPLLFIQHANIKFPYWLERSMSSIFVTSSWHKVHHSDEQRYTDSHYGNTFTFWDRIFGTYHRNVAIGKLSWGLKHLKSDNDQTVKNQLMLPFKSLTWCGT